VLEPLEVEIRTLHAILGSDRDPEGRAFAPLADAYRRSGNPRKAFSLLRDGLARLPDFSTGHVVAARLFTEQGMPQEGESAARRALALDPENVSAMATLVRVLAATGRTDQAVEVFATLEAIEPEVVEEYALERPGVTVLEMEEIWDIALLAPDPDPLEGVDAGVPDVSDEEEVLDIAALAPDEVILDIAALAPDEVILDIAALAPDEVILDIAALVPDEVILDIAALAPDEDDDAVLEIAALAPHDEGAVILEVAELAPDAVALVDEVVEREIYEVRGGGGGLRGADRVENPFSHEPLSPLGARPAPPRGGAPRIYTRTLGELYARQGFIDRAVEVFRQLWTERPDDAGLARRLAELEDQLAGRASPGPAAGPVAEPTVDAAVEDVSPVPEEPAPAETATVAAAGPLPHRDRDEELETLARDLMGHAERHPEIDTPFAWTDGVDEEAAGGSVNSAEPGPTIGSYFDDLLGWQPKDSS